MAQIYGRNRNIIVNIVYPEGVTGNPQVTLPAGRTFAQIESLLPKPEKVDYKLTHWSIEGADGAAVEPSTEITSGMTLYPVFVNNVCYITFDLQGGTGNIPQQKVTKGQTWAYVKGLITNPTREGHNFTGFSETVGGAVLSDEFTFNVDNITIYALWEIIRVTVSFDPNGGSPTPDSQVVDYGTTWGQIKGKVQSPTKEGYTFLGWEVA